MLCLGLRIDQFFTASQLILKTTKNKVLTYYGPNLHIYPAINVSMYLELDCFFWHKSFFGFVCCHFIR